MARWGTRTRLVPSASWATCCRVQAKHLGADQPGCARRARGLQGVVRRQGTQEEASLSRPGGNVVRVSPSNRRSQLAPAANAGVQHQTNAQSRARGCGVAKATGHPRLKRPPSALLPPARRLTPVGRRFDQRGTELTIQAATPAHALHYLVSGGPANLRYAAVSPVR